MFSLKKKSLTKALCAALTLMSALPFGVAKADKYGNNTVTVTDAGETGNGTIFWGVTECYVFGSEFNKLTVDVNKNYKNKTWIAAYSAPNDIWNVFVPIHNNELLFKNGTANDLYGGSINKKDNYNDVWENSVIVTGGTAKNVYGGWTGKDKHNKGGQAYNNSVTIEGGTVNEVCGGYSAANSSYSNTVNIEGGNVGNVFGSRSWGADFLGIASHDNSVTVSGGKVNGNIHGGYNGLETYKNSVTIEGGTVNGNIYGGFSADDNLYSNSNWNTVSIAGGTIIGNTYGGYSDGGGYVYKNIVTVTNGTIKGNIYGGSQNNNFDLYNNTVNIGSENSADKITITGNVYGGSNLWGDSRDNIVNISGNISEINGKIYGGHTDTDVAYRNTVAINGGFGTISGEIYGGWSNNDTYNNTINFKSGTFGDGSIYGGYSTNTRSYNNTVNISENSIMGNIYGSYSEKGTAYNNTVNITKSLGIHNIYGSYSDQGAAYGNTLNISNLEMINDRTAYIIGSKSNQGSAYGNTLNIKSVKGYMVMIFGSSSGKDACDNTANITDSTVNRVFGGRADSGIVSGNIVNLSNTNVIKDTSNKYGDVYGGSNTNGEVKENTVNILNGSSIDKDVYGGYSTKSNATGNAVNLSGGKIGLTGDPVSVYGGYSKEGNAEENVVNLNNGTIGWAKSNYKIYGGYSEEGNTNDNVVNLNGATLGRIDGTEVAVYGGFSKNGNSNENIVNIDCEIKDSLVDIYGGWSAAGKTTDNNTVNLLKTSTVRNLYGGNDKSSTGNTLNVYQADNKVTGKLDGFHIVNFFVPDAPLATDKAMLTVSSANFNQYSVINLDKVSAYNLTLLKYESLSAKDLLYSIGSNRIYGGTNTAVKENGHVTVASGQFVNDTTENEIRWEVNPGTFYTGVYYDADGNKTNADNNKAVLASAPAGIKKVYGSYSDKGDVKAENGIVELAGKIERAGTDGLNLIGGFNSASADKVGSNTLNVLGAAAGSSVSSVEKFDTINLYAPGYSSDATPLLYADTINFDKASVINLDVIPTYDLTLLKWDTWDAKGNTIEYKFAGVKGEIGTPYFRAMADEANHRVAVAEGKLSIADKSLKWTVEAGAFYTGIYYPRAGAEYPDIVKVTDNKVILDSETAKGANTVYGSYSANSETKADGGIVELAGKVTSDTLELIGGGNSAPEENVGNNTLNVLGAAAGSSVNKIEKFTSIEYKISDIRPEAGTPMITAKTADLSKTKEIKLTDMPAGSVTLLQADSLTLNTEGISYKIGDKELTGENTCSKLLENKYQYLLGTQGRFNVSEADKKISLDINKFLTAVYTDADGNTRTANDQKTIFMVQGFEVPEGVTRVYGSYSDNASKQADGGTIDLTAKQSLDSIDLIGGYNSADASKTGTNTLNVRADAAGSSAGSISAFSNINFYIPESFDPAKSLLSVKKADIEGADITLDKLPTYNLTLLSVTGADAVIDGSKANYKIEDDVAAFGAEYSRATTLSNRVEVVTGILKNGDDDKSIIWNVSDKPFYTGIYHYSAASGKDPVAANDEKKVILSKELADGVTKIYGSYSTNSDVTAENGTVELIGKLDTAADIELIGGCNSAGGAVGSNTLNVLGTAAGSSVSSVEKFDTINLYAPGNSTDTTPLLYAKTINFAENSTINLDIIPLYSMTLLKWENKNEAAVKYKFAGVEGELNTEYVKATADEVSHHVAVAKGKLSETDSSLKWTVTDNSFYTGIFYPREGAVFPDIVAVKDNKVILNAKAAKGVNTVYGSYSANGGQPATNGIVELVGKIERAGAADGLDLIGGYNLAGGAVGSNTLKVLGSAAGSGVNSIKDFSEIDFYVPDETGTMLTVSDGNIAGAKIKLEYAPAFDLTLLKAGAVDKTGTTYWIGDKQLTADAANVNRYNYFNIVNNNTNLLVFKGHIDTSADISWKYNKSILTGKYTDEAGKTYSALNDTIVLNDNLNIPAGITEIYGSYSETGSATGGTVDISGFTHDDIDLIGGNGGNASGSTLNVRSIGNSVKGISGFTNINFYIPEEAVDRDTMLKVNSAVNLDGTTIKAGVATGSELKKDNVINLLEAAALSNVPANMTADLLGTGLVEIKGTVKQDGSRIVLRMNEDVSPALDEDSKSLAETRAGGMAVLNTGADFATGKGFTSAQAAAEAESSAQVGIDGLANNASIVKPSAGFTPYATISGSDMRYETGSYVDSKGWGVNVGFARIINYENSKLTLVPFVEYGKSSYDSYLNNGTHGSGDNSFTGIGIMAKNEQKNGLYYEGSARFGRVKSDYDGGALLGRYNTASNYMAFHIGAGKVQKISKKSSLDFYGKLFYTHQNGDSPTITRPEIGDSFVYDFDAINSYRLRLGTRWNQRLGERDVFYAGIAWDYEFDSEARAHYNGMTTPAPSMKGSSGMLELGWKQEATKDNPFGVELGATGWCGKQKGIQFNAGFSWAF